MGTATLLQNWESKCSLGLGLPLLNRWHSKSLISKATAKLIETLENSPKRGNYYNSQEDPL